jgi:hypothetical protein
MRTVRRQAPVIPSEPQGSRGISNLPADELRHHRVVQKRTQISQITLMAQKGSHRLAEFHLRVLRNQRDLRQLFE